MTRINIIEPKIKEQLHDALVVYFLNENDKLGIGIQTNQIHDICKFLLTGNEETPDIFPTWQISEQTVFDEYRQKDVEIIDYLHLISIDLRKKLGQYATPRNIVSYILKSAGYFSSKDILYKRLIDPACGSGAFLVEATRVYLNALKKARTPLHKWYPMAIAAIKGIDVDVNACFFARLNLSTLLAPYILEVISRNGIEELKPLPVHCADTLQVLASEKKNNPLFYDRPNIQLQGRFDFVLGNPPYFKIKNMGQDMKDAFSDSVYGHPNAYALFIQAGIEMLRADGRLGFIIPRSMLSGLYFKNLRSYVENKTTIKEIVHIADRKKVFDAVLHSTMILSLQRNNTKKRKINISFAQSREDIEGCHSAISVDANKVIQHLNGTSVWFVADSVKIYNIINRIIKENSLLSGEKISCRAKTGQIVWNRIKPLLDTIARADTLPLIWATDVGKFSFSFNRAGEARPCFLKVSDKTQNLIVKGLSILVQRVTADEQPSRIVACIPDEFINNAADGYFVENHLNIIQTAVENSAIDPYFILGVLNSEIVEFFFRAMNGNTQVSATELNLLPIPIGRYEHEIAEIAKAIQTTANVKQRKQLLDGLNHVVANAYGLSEDELAFIKKYIGNRINGKSNDN